MSSIYTPNNWQLVRVTPKDTSAIYYRILAGWSGSFMYGSSWKLSSGCERVIEDGGIWEVPQNSGSVYILRKNSEHTSLAVTGVLQSIIQSNPETKIEIVKMESILGEFGL